MPNSTKFRKQWFRKYNLAFYQASYEDDDGTWISSDEDGNIYDDDTSSDESDDGCTCSCCGEVVEPQDTSNGDDSSRSTSENHDQTGIQVEVTSQNLSLDGSQESNDSNDGDENRSLSSEDSDDELTSDNDDDDDSSDKETVNESSASSDDGGSDPESSDQIETVPGALSAAFKKHLDRGKRLCLSQPAWAGAVGQIKHAIEDQQIDKVVVLCLSSLYRVDVDHDGWCYELAFVLAIFELVKEEAERSGTPTPQLIFQDPSFSAPDRRLLTELGHHVIDHPAAFFDEIDQRTLLFARNPPYVLMFPWIFAARPAVLITEEFDAALACAIFYQKKEEEVNPAINISETARAFMSGRKRELLQQVMLPYGSRLNNFVDDQMIYWVDKKNEAAERAGVAVAKNGRVEFVEMKEFAPTEHKHLDHWAMAIDNALDSGNLA